MWLHVGGNRSSVVGLWLHICGCRSLLAGLWLPLQVLQGGGGGSEDIQSESSNRDCDLGREY